MTRTAVAHSPAHAHHVGPVRRPGHQWRFARHYGVMLVLMFAGMAVLGGLAELMLMPFGQSMNEAAPPVMASVMAVTMTVPMVGWMHLRHRMPVARSVEMTASMVVPTVLAVVLHALAMIGSDAVLVVQHLVMLPAMLAVMVWRYDAYSH